MKLTIPDSIRLEHEELTASLAAACRIEGALGDAAGAVARILNPHLAREEEFALPPLSLLPLVAQGSLGPEVEEVGDLTERLKRELPRMRAEHQQIVGALQVFADVARREGRLEFVEFAKKLVLHARFEEEILYPAAVVLGEYVRLKLAQTKAA